MEDERWKREEGRGKMEDVPKGPHLRDANEGGKWKMEDESEI